MKKTTALLAATALTLSLIPLTACNKTQDENRSKYAITAAYDEANKTLNGVVDFTYYNGTGNEISDLAFN
ncbi:MAG: hypothetical protein K2K38_02725, partial [Clostridia bacterium]|nr:hypothetical protein [Clostridia bacterium]